MSHIQRSALVSFTPRQMFDLVNDVESYPTRFDWCDGARIEERGEDYLVAALDVGLGAFKASFTTKNTLKPPSRIGMSLVDGPFQNLSGGWVFHALGNEGCKVSLVLEFEMAGFMGAALAMGFQGLADRMVDDFVREAKLVYG